MGDYKGGSARRARAAIEAWMSCSLSVSRLLVASSRMRIWGRARIARQGQPLLLAARKLDSPSPMNVHTAWKV